MSDISDELFDFSWRKHALCKGMQVSDFFPERINQSNRQKYNTLCSMCSECPVILDCFYEAVTFEYDGLWGGTLMKERTTWYNEIVEAGIELTYELCSEYLDIKNTI